MTIVYNGNRANYNSNTRKTSRTATIYFNEDNNFDCQVTEYVIKVLEINGWPTRPYDIAGMFDIEVANRDEYNALVCLYKNVMKSARLNAMFFPKKSALYFEL